MRVMGIDPGLRSTGWGIVDSEGQRLRFVDAGEVTSDPKSDLACRLKDLHSALISIAKNYIPNEMAIEETFVNNNPASTLKLGQARGVALLVPGILGIPVTEYSATSVKKSVTGTGHAEKGQVRDMIKLLIPGVGELGFDATDALAIAICHCHSSETNNRWYSAIENAKASG